MSPRPSIAAMNDLLRTTFLTGRIVLTEGIRLLPEDVRAEVLSRVRAFEAFTPDNDPDGEHDFGSFHQDGAGTVFFKIDYYDQSLSYGSTDPADPTKTVRVLTVMLSEEW